MYLAPLNYDRFFRKVFKDTNIAKKFLEDFLNVEITEIEKLEDKHRITDDAAVVEFDYRCKINDKFVIIDMQQWYKTDVIKRFYLYHCLNSGLQLEQLPEKLIIPDKSTKSEKKTQKDYEYIEPVYTLIWMVDDSLGFSDDFAQFSMNHEAAVEFINNNELWQNPELKSIIEEREKVITKLTNNTKDLSFLAKNKLIFMFQKNIVKNLESNRNNKKYQRWFDFAGKTRNKLNCKNDFKLYKEDGIFPELIRRLDTSTLEENDIKYIEEEDDFIRLALDYYKKQNEKIVKSKHEGIEQGREEGEQLGRIKGRTQGIEQGAKLKAIEAAKNMLEMGLTTELIVQAIGLPAGEIEKLRS